MGGIRRDHSAVNVGGGTSTVAVVRELNRSFPTIQVRSLLDEDETPEDEKLIADSLDHDSGGLVALSNGILTNVHNSRLCEGKYCWVHKPSSHHMAAWPIRWRSNRSVAHRLCIHGFGHPDPDDVNFNVRAGRNVNAHRCDGCCIDLARVA